MNGQHRQNPWKLTPREISVIELYMEFGTIKRVSLKLEISGKTVEFYMRRAREKMKVTTTLQAVLVYDRLNHDCPVPIQQPQRKKKVSAWEPTRSINSVFALGAA